MYISLRKKLFIPLLTFSVVGMLFIYFVWLPHNHKLLMHDHHKVLHLQLENIAGSVNGLLFNGELDTVYATLDSLSQKNKNWIAIKAYDHRGKLLYSSHAKHIDISDVIHSVKLPVNYKGKLSGYFELIADFSERHAELESQGLYLLLMLILAVLLMTVVATLSMEFAVRRPIAQIAKAADDISNGNYDMELPHNNDEIGDLVKRFMLMRDGIVKREAELVVQFDAKQKIQTEIDLKDRQISSILKNSTDAYISIDFQQNMIFKNTQAERLFDITSNDVLGKNIWDSLPELASFLYKPVNKVLANNYVTKLEAFYPPNKLWLDVHIFKTNEGVSIYLGDISSRKKTEQSLKKNEEYQRAILNNIADGIITINQKGIILSFNPAASEMFGYSVTEAVGSSVSILMDADLASVHGSFLSSYKEQDNSSIGLTRNLIAKRKNGELFPVEIAVTEMFFYEDVQFIGIIRDITARIKSDEQLRLAEKIFEGNNEAIVITDDKSHILRVNKSFLRITGYEENEVIGEKISMLSSGRHDEPFYKKMWQGISGYGHWQGEIWNKRKSGEIYPEWLSISSVYDKNHEVVNYVGIFSDITDKKEAEERIYHMAHNDALTGLLNRAMFNIELANAIKQADIHSSTLAVLYIDLDHFKKINDTLGHPVGDELLKVVAQRLKKLLRSSDIVCRIGGDEFVVLLQNVTSINVVENIANNIIDKLRESITLEKRELFIGSSIGIASYPQDAGDGNELVRYADIALFRAKELGRNNYQLYSNEMNARASERLELESKLHYALGRQEFVLHYQPQMDLYNKTIIGVEALIRWHHPDFGLIPPDEFIPLLEESGMIIPVGEWILFSACLHAKAWQDNGLGDIRVGVNISPHQFLYSDIVTSVNDALSISGLAPHLLELEITEGSIMEDAEANIRILQQLSAMGVKLSIDDFGTGYSSLSYLKRFPINTLKIDKSFVRNMHNDEEDEKISAAIISLGKSLGIRIIAEGVEQAEHLHQLSIFGCDEVQGYFISRPLEQEKLITFLKQQKQYCEKLIAENVLINR